MSIKNSLTNEQLSEMSPWDIASHLGIGYSGDMNPIEHGGYFYSLEEWEKWDYANAVEFWEDPETGNLIVQTGTIHKPDNDTLQSAFRDCGFPSDDLKADPAYQIECTRDYCGMEPDGTTYPHLKSFRLEDWKERNIWKSIRGWIEELAQ